MRLRRKAERATDEQPATETRQEAAATEGGWLCGGCLSRNERHTVAADRIRCGRCGTLRPDATVEESAMCDFREGWPATWGAPRSWDRDDRMWLYDPHLLESRGPR